MSITLSPDLITFIESGVSITVGSRDARHLPSIVRALACRVLADRQTVRLWLSSVQSRQLRLDCAASDNITAVFSEVSTHRTFQIKGDQIKVDCVRLTVAGSDLSPQENRVVVDAHQRAFGEQVAALGFSWDFTHNLMRTSDDDIVVIEYRAQSVYDQSPGPNAGQKLELAP